MELKEKERILYLDILNIIACIAVVCMHVNGTAVNTFSRTGNWIFSLCVDCICYFAVPVFFMITGATLIDYRKRYDTKTFAKKRISRTIIPFLFWSIVAILWCILALKVMQWSDVSSPIKLINVIFNVKAFNIYYFFIDIFAVYLCIPFLSMIPEDKRLGKTGAFTYLLVYGLFSVSILPTICGIVGVEWNNNLRSPLLGGYLIYVLLGYYVSKTDFKKENRRVIYLLGIAGLLIHIGMTALWSFRDGAMNFTFRGYTNFPTVFYSLAIFVAIKYYSKVGGEKIQKSIVYLSGASFGVYLIHKYPIYILCYMLHVDDFSVIWRIVGTIMVYVISVVIVKCLQKIPIISKLIP